MIQSAVFGFEVGNKGFFRERSPRDLFDELSRSVASAVAMDLFLQPLSDEGELSLCDLFFPSGVRRFKGLEKLRRIEIPKRVRREIADSSHRPMNVLQTPDAIIEGRDPEISAHFFIPHFGDLLHANGTVDQSHLNLKAYDDVERVGDFICLYADQRGSRFVDRSVEIVERDFPQLLREFCL